MSNIAHKKDKLFSTALESAVKTRESFFDFHAMLEEHMIAEASTMAAAFGVNQNLGRGFVIGEFAKMKADILGNIAKEAARDVANARIKADDVAEKYRRGLEELTEGGKSLFEKLRARLPTQLIDSSEFVELVEYSAQLQRIEDDVTEQSIDIAKNFAMQLADYLRQSFVLELRLVFRSAFITEPEVEELVQFYLKELPKLQLAA